MKKIITVCSCICLSLLLLTGCNSKEKNLSYSASEIIEKLYEGVNENDLPELKTTEVVPEMVEYTIGTKDIDYKEIVASEPWIGSMAYSIVVVKLNEGADVEEAKKLIKENVDPRKWLCVDAEIVTVDNIGDTILLVMMDEEREELAKKVQENFKKLK